MAQDLMIGETKDKFWLKLQNKTQAFLIFSTIFPVENMFVAALAAGEGWHNYHHAFPWDYRAAELGTPLNLTCKFIDFFAKYGAIYDLREATATMVKIHS
jgi:fatty-acid desaturase